MSLVEKPKGEPFDNGPVRSDGQFERYAVLPKASRQPFVRPVRRTYRHVGVRPTYPTRELTPDEHRRYDQYGYVAYEAYPPDAPEGGGSVTGRFWTEGALLGGCQTETWMSQELAETYAADPGYYGATFCVHCGGHFPVEEFVWTDDGTRVGS